MESFWNERYAQPGYLYGREPNDYFREVLNALPPGRILVPGAGEGRDACYAASRGWQVTAFDFSSVAREKALHRAQEENLAINYLLANAASFDPGPPQYNAIAMIYFHLPPAVRVPFHRKMAGALEPGGRVILEAFNPRQLEYSSGGPGEESLLYTASMLQNDFAGLEILECREIEVELNESPQHRGKAAVVRFTGQKKPA